MDNIDIIYCKIIYLQPVIKKPRIRKLRYCKCGTKLHASVVKKKSNRLERTSKKTTLQSLLMYALARVLAFVIIHTTDAHATLAARSSVVR